MSINKGKHRPQDDLPYERQMFYIIRDYRRMLEKLDYISGYARKLEEELGEVMDKRAKTVMHNIKISEELASLRQELKRMHVEMERMRSQLTSRFSAARCCVCGKQVRSGYVWDGKSVICSDKCGHIVFSDDPAAFDILVDEGDRMVWHDDLTEI